MAKKSVFRCCFFRLLVIIIDFSIEHFFVVDLFSVSSEDVKAEWIIPRGGSKATSIKTTNTMGNWLMMFRKLKVWGRRACCMNKWTRLSGNEKRETRTNSRQCIDKKRSEITSCHTPSRSPHVLPTIEITNRTLLCKQPRRSLSYVYLHNRLVPTKRTFELPEFCFINWNSQELFLLDQWKSNY